MSMFRAFICHGLNTNNLTTWLHSVIYELRKEHYNPNSFIGPGSHQTKILWFRKNHFLEKNWKKIVWIFLWSPKVKNGYEQFLSTLLPLDKLRFSLPANLAIKNLDELNHAFWTSVQFLCRITYRTIITSLWHHDDVIEQHYAIPILLQIVVFCFFTNQTVIIFILFFINHISSNSLEFLNSV